MNNRLINFGCLALILFACKDKTNIVKESVTPKNVILLIGDGMGLSQVSSAFYFKESSPNFARFKHIGLIKTSSSREDITDSAAAATAFASGVKTYNGAIGVADDSTNVENLVEIISSKNIKSGLVSTSSITHATPAAFYAHNISRGSAEEIALDLAQSDVDFFAGGGIRYFNNRNDNRNLLKELKDKDFKIDTTALSHFSAIQSYKKAAFLLANNHMPPTSKGRGDFLTNATELGIQFLIKDEENSNFFMMVEGSQIDWGGHANNGAYLVSELIDFDDAIGKALDFAEKDGNTLVIVTADHETGGLTLSSTLKETEDGNEYSDYSKISMTFSTGGHSATLIPVFAYGPGSKEFIGIYENTAIFDKILKATKWRKEN
ncbi:alkaline phosphatase [Flavobacteriaceae bacterium AH-315-B10]|nr:alkaline phosphatase [Flavobacteriaceae bacterium AH-315-B10]